MIAGVKYFEIQKSFGKLKVLRGINLELAQGKVTGILGPNGCGKTTLIKILLGLVVQDKGKVEILGKSTQSGPSYRNQIGYMPQMAEFPVQSLCGEWLDLLEGVRKKKAGFRSDLIEAFGLKDVLQRPLGVLSGGTRQKVAAVAAMMFNPEVLVLDEPTVGLDPVATMIFKDWLKKFVNEGRTVLLVSHMLSEMEQLADDLVILHEGKVVDHRPLSEIKGNGTLEHAWIEKVRRA